MPPVKLLSVGEKRLIGVLLRSQIVQEGIPFTSAEAWDLMKDTPTRDGYERKILAIPNKYKLTQILKKSVDFTRTRNHNGTSIWVYIGDGNAP